MTKRKRARKRKLWSVTRIAHPRFPGYMLRVTELTKGGDLYTVRMIGGKQKMAWLRPRCTRLDLGHNEQAQHRGACARAFEIIEALAKGGDAEPVETGAVLTLSTLAILYEQHGLHGVSTSYRRDQVAKLHRIKEFLGAERLVVSLCRTDVEAFAAARLMHVSRNTIHGDVGALKIALNWATEHKWANGQPLLDRSPLVKVRVPRETPQRPWATAERYQKLKSVADQLPPGFECVLDLAWGTGRRIGAILALKWQDVNFEVSERCPQGPSVRWYAQAVTNNKRRDQVVRMNTLAASALKKWRELRPGIGSAPVFASPKNPREPLGKWVAKGWLQKAERLAGVEHEAQSGWHAMRRGWATQRKDMPLVDVAAAGGWRDTATLARCYTHPDPATTWAVIAHNGT